ncbi:MAG: flagellar biosynthesis protein FliQ [Thermodesulfobacteriota bacterium]|nr:flagellar biosynthesis protein FliQ [Thermodesulfobacteriota bacterium]
MTSEFVIGIFLEALKVVACLTFPTLCFGLIAGLLVAVFQAATQIHEMTLTFIPKMVAVVVALIIFAPWMLETLLNFTSNLFMNIPNYVRWTW